MIDFSKFPKDLNNLLANIIVLPYWYISVYLFHRELYESEDHILIFALCICLTVSSSLVASFFGTKYILDSHNVRLGIIIQVAWFSLLLMASYLHIVKENKIFEFYGFVGVYFSVLILLVFISALSEKETEKPKGEKTKQKEKLPKEQS